MDSPNDHIRRVLSDGATPLPKEAAPRLRQVVESTPGTREATLDRIPAALRARLEALGVGVGAPAPGGRTAPRQRPTAEVPVDADEGEAERGPPAPALPAPQGHGPSRLDGAPTPEADVGTIETWALEDWVGGEERDTPHGPFLYVERHYALESTHGRLPLAAGLAHPIPLRPHERGPQAGEGKRDDAPPTTLDARDAVFFDTETTGLSGGTGTVAFLVGTGRVEGNVFVVRQYCMRDYPEEAALLHALAEDVGDAPVVSFNGRSFDWPLLATRFRLHRMDVPRRAHLDLLPPARRIWARTLHSHGLAALERHVLGLDRGEDLPGWRIPTAYFDFLRTGHADVIAQAFRHNEIDVISMLVLFAQIADTLHDPIRPVRRPRDQLGTARLLLDLGRPEDARRCLEAGLDGCADGEGVALERLLGRLYRQAGQHEKALAHWQRVAEDGPFDLEAHEQVAKILEHRFQRFEEALAWTEKAQAQADPGSHVAAALAHRAARLRRRSRARPAAPEATPEA